MDSPANLNSDLIARSINFHGQLLQKTWETERGVDDLQKLGVSNLNFEIYAQRQKHLSFQDRGKRMKLHHFISKRAGIWFDPTLIEKEDPQTRSVEPGHFAVMPAFETFLNLDKTSRSQHFLQCLRPGDVIISSINNKANSGLFLKVLCLDGENARSVSDLNIKAFCPTSNLISAIDKKNIPRSFMLNDLVACEVLEVIPDSEKIICGMKGVHASEHKARLGFFHSDDFPEAYKMAQDPKNEPYEVMLEKTVGFNNPSNVTCLSTAMGLGSAHHTNHVSLKGRFPEAEYATELRNTQAAKWAFKNVAEGIEHFKAGRQTEAFQCLNKALAIDSSNIEGLVARGALFANSGSFKKAIEDFECALKQNHSHANARKYMGETLVAYGRSFEDQSQMDEALKCYEKCLEIVPYHDEAMNSIEFIKTKMANGSLSMTDGLVPQGLSTKAQGVKDTLKLLLGSNSDQPAKEEVPGSAKKKKKEKKAKKHKRHSSSSSSSSSSGSSSSSSSSSSSDSSSASSNDSHRKKKHKSRKSEPKEKSLSPLSKRMAIMDSTSAAVTDGQRGSHYNPPAMPYSFSSEQTTAVASAYPASAKSDKESEYEQRVCKFLEQTKGDSDYEEKVRKFLDETAKWKKERKAIEEKAKKKRKKEKKARSKSKKKKREERKKKKMLKEFEEKKLRDALRKQRRKSNVEEDEEFLYGEKPDLRLSLPDLEDLQSKLSYYVKVEKGNTSKKKEKSSSVEKLVAAAQAKAKANSPKLMYMHDEDKEESRLRKMEKKKMDMFEDSPPQIRVQDAKNVPLPSAPPPPSSKFKMQIGTAQTRLKKRPEKDDKEPWDDVGEKRFIYMSEGISAPKEPEPKKLPEKKKEIEDQMAKTPMVLDKLGGFRINPLNAEKKPLDSDRTSLQKRKLRQRVSESDSSDSEIAKKKERQGRSPGSSRSRSRSRSHKKYSSDSPPPKKYSSSSSRSPSYRKDRSRSKSGSYRSRSGRRYHSSESGSYRSRSYSRSRSRSRSMDYHRRSRSRSDDRHRYHKYPGRYPRNRGTYYRPRFQTGFKTRPGGFFPRGNRWVRGGPWRPGGRPFIPRMRGRGRPRFFHYNNKPRDDRYRRYDRDMSRSDDDDGSPMRKVDAAKERIDRMLSEDKRHTGPLSEGEERDDDYIDRKDYDRDRSGNPPRDSSSPDMDRSKKEGSKERNKSSTKPNPW